MRIFFFFFFYRRTGKFDGAKGFDKILIVRVGDETAVNRPSRKGKIILEDNTARKARSDSRCD